MPTLARPDTDSTGWQVRAIIDSARPLQHVVVVEVALVEVLLEQFVVALGGGLGELAAQLGGARGERFRESATALHLPVAPS